jgi:hypothetical protein
MVHSTSRLCNPDLSDQKVRTTRGEGLGKIPMQPLQILLHFYLIECIEKVAKEF